MKQTTLPELQENDDFYAGAITTPDGATTHFWVLKGAKENVTWQQAMDWAKEQGGDLPNRVEQALLFDQHKDKFEERAYWSNTQHASDSSYAWSQLFSYGSQGSWYETDELCARAVRRLVIQ